MGTGICLVNQHQPINLAKSVATLQHFSGGHVELGGGPGWNADEMENHGVDPGTRFAAMRERISELQARAADADRDPVPVTIYQPRPRPEVVEEYRRIGVSRLLCALPAASPDETLDRVDRYARTLL